MAFLRSLDPYQLFWSVFSQKSRFFIFRRLFILEMGRYDRFYFMIVQTVHLAFEWAHTCPICFSELWEKYILVFPQYVAKHVCKCDKLATLDPSRPKGKCQNWLPVCFQTLQGAVSSCTNGHNLQIFLGDGGAFQSRFMDAFLLYSHIFSFFAEIQHYSSMTWARDLKFCIQTVLDFVCWFAPKLIFLWASYFF